MNIKASSNNSIQRMIATEIYKLRLLNPNIMNMSHDSIILLAVNALRMDEQEKNEKGLVTWVN